MRTEDRFAIFAASLTDDPRQAVRRARTLGFAGVLFNAYAPGLDLPDLSASGRREFRRMIAAEQRQLIGLRMDLNPHGFSPGTDVDCSVARIDRAMEAAASLGAPLLCLDLGPLPAVPHPPRPRRSITSEQAGLIIIPPTLAATPEAESAGRDRTPPQVDATFAAWVDGALAEIGHRADRYGTRLALRSDLSSFAALARALKAAACPWFGLDLDPVAVLRDPWSLDVVLANFGNTLWHVRARDAACGADQRTTPTLIGQGSFPWAELFAELDAGGYQGWITIDTTELPSRQPAAASALQYLQALKA